MNPSDVQLSEQIFPAEVIVKGIKAFIKGCYWGKKQVQSTLTVNTGLRLKFLQYTAA